VLTGAPARSALRLRAEPLELVDARRPPDGAPRRYVVELKVTVANAGYHTVEAAWAEVSFVGPDGTELRAPEEVPVIHTARGAMAEDPDNYARYAPLTPNASVRVSLGRFAVPARNGDETVPFENIKTVCRLTRVAVQ
jgi:hypothetical protein